MGDWYIGQNGRWVYDPDAPTPSRDPTTAIPQVNLASLRDVSRETSDGDDVPRVGDTGDWVDPNAPDPTDDEVTDPDDPNYVDPWPRP